MTFCKGKTKGPGTSPEETVDTLFHGKLRIIQAKRGYRFSLDAVLLAHFVTLRGSDRVIDLGTGNGVIPLILARLHPAVEIVGMELQEEMVRRALRNVNLNRLEERVKILRTWTGLCDLSPDYSPILGKTELEGFHISAGWGTYGFKAAPIVGTTLAELVATGRTPDLIAPFALERFHTDTLVSELAAAAVSH